MRLFIKRLARTHPNRMVLLNVNRHILGAARTMMIHMHVSKFLWSDAMLSACYLINRMPSSIFNSTIPFSCLYPHKSVLSMTPHF